MYARLRVACLCVCVCACVWQLIELASEITWRPFRSPTKSALNALNATAGRLMPTDGAIAAPIAVVDAFGASLYQVAGSELCVCRVSC